MLVIVLTVISLIPILLGNESTKQYASLILCLYSIVGFLIFYKPKQLAYLATPISLIFFYTSLSLMFGAWGFENGFVIVNQNYRDYQGWQKMDQALCLVLLCLTAMAAVESVSQKKYQVLIPYSPFKSEKPHLLVGLPLLIFYFIPLNLDQLGGQGDLAIMPKTVSALFVIIYSQNVNRASYRWLINLTIIFLFSTFSIEDKREAIFLIFPIVYLEVMREQKKITLGLGLNYTIIVLFLTSLILAMSVARGYGQIAGIDNLFDAIPTIWTYLRGDDFLAGFLANIEVSYFFFHAINSVDYVLNNPDVLSFGSTIIKPAFLFIPRQIAPWKPVSIIDKYTTAYDPEIRDIGGSWPISMFSEFIWNFHFFGIIFAFLIAKILVRYQISMLAANKNKNFFQTVFFLFAYTNIVTLARGSGFDQYMLFLFLGATFISLCRGVYLVQSRPTVG
jgi:hypothetical protein